MNTQQTLGIHLDMSTDTQTTEQRIQMKQRVKKNKIGYGKMKMGQ